MRSYDASDESDQKDAQRIGAEPWMLDLLKLNPEYVYWSPGEDYMKPPKDQGGWDSGVEIATWKEFSWSLDDINECVHFYFQIRRASENCDCDGGYNTKTRKIYNGFYEHLSGPRECWRNKLTQDEVDALGEAGRLNHEFKYQEWDQETKSWRRIAPSPTTEQVNAWSRANRGIGHDAINCHILVETRAKRLGVYGVCDKCDGHASVYTEPTAHASLVLWMLHPRKGASRGVEIQHLDADDLPAIKKWLRKAASRNAKRFQKVLSGISDAA